MLTELGYEKFQEWNKGFSFKMNDGYLVFVQTEEKYLQNKYNRKNTGLNHFAFYAENKAQVDKLAMQLKQKGIKMLYEDKFPFASGKEHYAVYFEDPDRIKVEVAV